MTKSANFRVDPRLANLLGESYRSTEQALKELIDNAWDADAANVWITLPDPVTEDPIVVKDDGCGMTDSELRSEYLNIASDRRKRKGEKTLKGRGVKGRKGIGKFAGLMAAHVMNVATSARGTMTSLEITRKALLESQGDLEQVRLPITTSPADKNITGTTIVLTKLNQNLSFPTASVLKEVLVLEYGRQPDFTLYVNGEKLKHQDIPGQRYTEILQLENGKIVAVKFTVMDDPTTKGQSGIVMRVSGKVIGRPTHIGIDEEEVLSPKLLRRIVGEIEADVLEDDLSGDGGHIVENSKNLKLILDFARKHISSVLNDVFEKEISQAKKKRQRKIDAVLSKMPENRRRFAEEHIDRLLRKFYGDSEEKIDVIVSVMLQALEAEDYWLVVKELGNASKVDMALLAEALNDFGLVDMAVMIRQAASRLSVLQYLENLAMNSATLEAEMHKALENNLWVFGLEFSIMASNRTLAAVIQRYTEKEFDSARKRMRPDLLLVSNIDGKKF